MKRTEKTFEKALILGAYPILALSTTAFEALSGVIVTAGAALLAALTWKWLSATLPKSVVWLSAIAVAGSIALVGALLLPYLFPISDSVTPLLAIAGITPIVFTGCANGIVEGETEKSGERTKDTDTASWPVVLAVFALMLFVAGIVRESLGSGTVFLRTIDRAGTIPAGIMNTPVGAFMYLAAAFFLVRLTGSRAAARSAKTTHANAGGTK